MQELLEQITERHTEKQIVSLCKKCLKKLSFKSGADVSNLTDLVFWLFIFGDNEAVFQLAGLTHGMPFDHNFSVWDSLHIIWALEVYLLRKSGDVKGADVRRCAILANLRLTMEDETQEEHDRREAKQYKRIDYKEWTYQLKIEGAVASGNKASANAWRLSALERMIGWGETGLYPDFVAHDEQREQEIVQYANILAGREESPVLEPDNTRVVTKRLPKKFRDACDLVITDRESGVAALSAPAFESFAHQRDAVFAELAYFDGDLGKALELDKTLCPYWGEWHYSNIRTEHCAAMTFAAFRLGKEAGLIEFFKEQIAFEQSRTQVSQVVIRGYEIQIERLTTGYKELVAMPRQGSLLSMRIKDRSLEGLKAYSASGLWRPASRTQVRPMELFSDVWLYPALNDRALQEIASAIVWVWK
ncbi:MAG: hypothetical protein FWD65_01890 [Coriobacteriia bacterium]|nr:hypothetical protein [Coriobacteriia bacterium]